MDRLRWIFLSVVLVRLCTSVAWGAEMSQRQVLVVLKNPFDEPLTISLLDGVDGRFYVAKVAWSVDARVLRVYQELSQAGGTIFALFESDAPAEGLTEALRKRPEVLAASVNGSLRVPLSPDMKEASRSAPSSD